MNGGGAQRVIIELLENLDRGRFKPALALFEKSGPYLSLVPEDVDLFEISSCNAGYKKVIKTRKVLTKIISQVKPDLINSHMLNVNLACLRSLVFSKHKIPIITVEHNNVDINIDKQSNLISKAITKHELPILYKLASKIITVSGGIKQNLVQQYKINPEKISIVYNPVNINNIKKRLTASNTRPLAKHNQGKQIVAAGRLTKQKGFADLITAFSILRRAVVAKLVILGSGELHTELKDLVKRLGLEDDVSLPGFVDNPWSIINESDLFVMSSYWEGFPMILLEVMACGTPIVSTDCNYGPRELIEHENNGLLVPVGDVAKLSEAMLHVLTDNESAEKFVANSISIINRFDSKVVTKNYEKIFEEVHKLQAKAQAV